MVSLRRRALFPVQAALLFVLTLFPVLGQPDKLAEQSRHGKELMAQGRFAEAATLYREMVKALPGNPGLLLNLGLAEEMSGHPDRAIPHFQAVLKAEPNSVPALSSLAMSHLQLNQPAAAVAPLKKLISLNRQDVNATGMLAGAELSLGKARDASEHYRQLTNLTPSDPKAWYGLGKAYEALAEESFERLAALDNQSGYVALLLAESRLQGNQYRSAFFFYREAEKKVPDLGGIHSGLARLYRSTKHPDWAAVEDAREQDPCRTATNPACSFTKGKFLELTASPSADAPALFWKARSYNALAAQSFDRLSQLPESVEQHAVKAQILHDHRQDLEASREWKAALQLAHGADQEQLQAELASSLFLAHDYASAIPALKTLLASNPQAPDLNFMLGESLWRTQQAEQALPFLRTAVQRNPDLLPAHAALGLTLASLGKNEEAIPHLLKAQTLDDDGSLHYSLARAYQATGNREQATANMGEYSKIQKKNAELNATVATESEIAAPPQ